MDFENESGIFTLVGQEIKAAPNFPRQFSILEGEQRKDELLELSEQAKLEAVLLLVSPINAERAQGRERLAVSTILGHMCTQLMNRLDEMQASIAEGIQQFEDLLKNEGK